MHMPLMARNRKNRQGDPSAYKDSDDIEVDEDVLIIGRTRSFERSLAERLDGSIKGHTTSRRSISRKISNQAIQPGSIGRRYHSFLSSLNPTLPAADVDGEDHFMLDLDEAWHPHGYGPKDRDHAEFLVELRGMTSGDESEYEDELATNSMARPVRPRRSAVPREDAMGGLKETFPVSPTSAADSPVAVITPQLQLAAVTVSLEMSEVLQDKPRSLSGASSPGSVMLSFRGKPRRGSKGSDGEVFGFSLPEEAVDMTDVYVHLGPSPRGANFRDAMHGRQGQGAGKESVPRSNSMTSIPSQSSTDARSRFLGERRKRNSTIDLAVLATHTEDGDNDDDGWFKLAKRENESWADFSQSLSRSKGAAIWQRLEQGERVPLPEPSFVGVSPRRRAATEDNRCLVLDADKKPESPTLFTGTIARNGPRSLSPTSQAITYSPSFERLTCGALPFLCETLQESTFAGPTQRGSSSPAAQHPFAGVAYPMTTGRASSISPSKYQDRQRSRTEFSHGFHNNAARIIPAQTGH